MYFLLKNFWKKLKLKYMKTKTNNYISIKTATLLNIPMEFIYDKDNLQKLNISLHDNEEEYVMNTGGALDNRIEFYKIKKGDILPNNAIKIDKKRMIEKNILLRHYPYEFININPFTLHPYSSIELGKESITYGLTAGLKYTFGVEIETINGIVNPVHYYNNGPLNMKCVRDGSLRWENGQEYGGEYVTGVLKGDSGMKQLYNILKIIDKYCTVDSRCGVHVHIGSMYVSKFFNVLSYLLGEKLQDEMFLLSPLSRRHNDTCGKLPKSNTLYRIDELGYDMGIEQAYYDLFQKISNGRKNDSKVNKSNMHPGGRYTDRYSRNIAPQDLYRYKIINYVPCFFNMKGGERLSGQINNGIKSYTLEFRSHHGSTCFKDIKNWILICMAFVNYAENHQGDIIYKEKITLSDIINAAYGNKKINNCSLADMLNEHVLKLKEKFCKVDDFSEEDKEYKKINDFSNNPSYKDILCV